MILLELKNIKIHYERVEAVKGVSIEIPDHAIVSLIGNNGAGKTTILKGIFGLKKNSSGEIFFAGKRIEGRSPQDIAKMGVAYCMEGRRLFPLMTVRENLEMGAYLRTDKKALEKDVEGIFERFPIIKDRQKQQAATLSGGQQQMVAIARALISKPKLLLMDEPSLGLAPLIVQEIANIVQEINRDGVAVLLVEQNSKLGLGVAQWGYVLEVGEVTLHGEAKALLENEHVKKAYLGG